MEINDQERLAAFEKMLAGVQANYAELTARLDRLKAEGREKSATFRQYLGNKMTCQYMLSIYRDYGLLEQPDETRGAAPDGG